MSPACGGDPQHTRLISGIFYDRPRGVLSGRRYFSPIHRLTGARRNQIHTPPTTTRRRPPPHRAHGCRLPTQVTRRSPSHHTGAAVAQSGLQKRRAPKPGPATLAYFIKYSYFGFYGLLFYLGIGHLRKIHFSHRTACTAILAAHQFRRGSTFGQGFYLLTSGTIIT